MISIANLLDSAKKNGNIESDYRLAKVIGVSHGTMSGYRSGKTKPDARVLEQLCALSGDDVAVFAAELQAERERTPEAKNVWLMIANRLRTGSTNAVLSALAAIFLIAGIPEPARAAQDSAVDVIKFNSLYIVEYAVLAVSQKIHAWPRRCFGYYVLCSYFLA
jgi:transcriptional regulator with XRE-family HTH domain